VHFALARNKCTGKELRSVFSSFGNFHLNTSQGPVPVSLVELSLFQHNTLPYHDAIILHSIAIGFPIVGDVKYIHNEKFYNPVVSPPTDKIGLKLQPWYRLGGGNIYIVEEDKLSPQLFDSPQNIFDVSQSILKDLPESHEQFFAGEVSSCRYTDHPEAVHVRRDRG
jgi:hypothetical protein